MNTSALSTEDLEIHKITNKNGMILKVLNLGATIYNLQIPDKDGNLLAVVVTPKHLKDYASQQYFNMNPCFGASVGRYAGRITDGKFLLNGKLYQLYEQDGVHLHGGFRGFQDRLWKLNQNRSDSNSLCFSYFSEDGEEQYPGNLNVEVVYTLTDQDELIISYEAETDKETPVNLTNHSYFNLNGGGSVSDHMLQVAAEKILETDKKLLPTGNFIRLKNTDKNFSEAKKIGNIPVDDTFILNGDREEAVKLRSEKSGLELKIRTNQPATVVYIPRNVSDKWEYKTQTAEFPSVCFEMQNFPDAPNHSNFPNSILSPGEKYRNESIFTFSLMKNPE